jgi:peptidoglycan/xylan/chitin deacetylase (PgdA/CDA1 family)
MGCLFATPALARAAPLTVVTIQFDDDNADVSQWISPLDTHGFPATFYVNSGSIESADHLTWAQLTALSQAGNEIASHTVDHVNIKKLKLAEARFKVCQDRVNLANHGFQPERFAYPFGSFNSTVQTQVVQFCGDNSARGVSGVNDRKVFAETIPPLNAYATRTPPDPKQGTTVATIEGYVSSAEQNGGGWVQLTFHHICDGCDAYSITSVNMQSLLDWLNTQVTTGAVVVKTTEQVIGGTYKTPFCC